MRELARKAFATDEIDTKESQDIVRGYSSAYSPDRKAIYESVMQKTGGKMPASSMFFDEQGRSTLSYEFDYGTYSTISTPEEFSRAREIYSYYFDEMDRLSTKYGDSALGHISYAKIEKDLAADRAAAQAGKGDNIDVSA